MEPSQQPAAFSCEKTFATDEAGIDRQAQRGSPGGTARDIDVAIAVVTSDDLSDRVLPIPIAFD